LRFGIRSATVLLRYQKQGDDAVSATVPRIPPVEEPYSPEIATFLAKWMPPGVDAEPLRLFRTLAVHPGLSSRMRPLGAGILAHGLIPPREREIVLLRTCARAGAEYEWGVHTVAYGRPLGLGEAQIAATVIGAPDDPAWSPRERALIALVDELHEGALVSDGTYAALAADWDPPEILELVTIAGWYRLLSGIISASGVELEPWADTFPGAPRYTK
jgi:4-carboxymuconolactone decarboxylase